MVHMKRHEFLKTAGVGVGVLASANLYAQAGQAANASPATPPVPQYSLN
jgi:hypothetical protein